VLEAVVRVLRDAAKKAVVAESTGPLADISHLTVDPLLQRV
jgi:hypothetical protein